MRLDPSWLTGLTKATSERIQLPIAKGLDIRCAFPQPMTAVIHIIMLCLAPYFQVRFFRMDRARVQFQKELLLERATYIHLFPIMRIT